MEMNYFKKSSRLMVAACMLAGMPMIPGVASASPLQTHIMSVQMESTTLKELFDLIESKFSYTFLVRNNDINLDERISIDMTSRSVEDILRTALRNQHADFIVNDNRIIVYKSTANPDKAREAAVKMIAQQTQTIVGTVIDAVSGEPVIGANVLVKGTTTGTSTDFDGNFSLEIPSGATLVVSYIGYINLEVKPTKGKMVIRIKEDTQALDEVVVVGYGVQKRESLTGAMQVVNNEKLTTATTPAVENMLTGKAPGVFVSPGNGEPGATGKIVIRGKSTVNGSTDPLWVIDGVIVGDGAGSLNPADVESMSILKDAASTAIYGSQGANGVIVVTTKKGKTGKATVNASVKLGISQLSKGNMEMMNGAELYDYYKSFPNQEMIVFSRYNEDLRNANYDWFKEGTKLGFAQDYNISLSGGTEKLKTYVSLGYYGEDGTIKDYNYKRYNFRFNVDYQVFDWLKLKPQVSGARKDIFDQSTGISSFYSMLPWDNPYDENGELVGIQPNPTWVHSTASNYMYDLQWDNTTSTAYEFMGNFDFDIKFCDWLTFSSVNNYRFTDTNRKIYTDPRSSGGKGTTGSLEDKVSQTYRVYSNQLLRFNKTFGKHSVNAIAAYEWNTYTGKVNEMVKSGFAPGFTVADAAAVPRKIGGSQNEWAVQSLLFNGNYSYDNRYLFQASFRRDGASNFGDNAKYGNFFSLSGGWNINREAFFHADWVDQLKLRVSYGSVGNRPTSLYPQYALYSTDKYNEQPGGTLAQISNPDLTWEKTFTTGVGIDARFFNRVSITMDYYNKNTSNLLYEVPLPMVTGVKTVWRNVGSVKNNGFEVSLGVDILKNVHDLNWRVDANLGLNRNKVTELYGEKPEIITDSGSGYADEANKILRPGLDADSWYMTEWAGVNVETGAPEWFTTNENGERVRTSDYADASKHKAVVGTYSPDFFGGFSTDLSWKQFDLSAMFTYSVGGKIYNYSRMEYDSDGVYTDRNQMKLQSGWSRWEKAGDVATHPLAKYSNNSGSNKGSSRYLEDDTYLKMKNLTIGYNLALPQWHIANLRIYFSGENLFTVTSFSGTDPELPASITNVKNGTTKITGVAMNPFPQTRKFMFGLNITL